MHENKIEVWDEATQAYIYLSPEQALKRDSALPARRNRYDGGANLVPAQPVRPTTPMAYPMPTESPMPLAESHLAALETIRETATPIERAIGLAIRVMPFSVVWLVLCFGLMVALDSDWPLPFLLFALATAVTYYALNRQEYTHSASGIERHKADLAHDLQSRRIDNDHELREKALDAYIRHLERDK